jgi:hypothetical protein
MRRMMKIRKMREMRVKLLKKSGKSMMHHLMLKKRVLSQNACMKLRNYRDGSIRRRQELSNY